MKTAVIYRYEDNGRGFVIVRGYAAAMFTGGRFVL